MKIRAVLVSVLQKQYSKIQSSNLTQQNIEALASSEYFYRYNWTSAEFVFWPFVFFV